MPLGGYRWASHSGSVHNATDARAFVLTGTSGSPTVPPRTHVRSLVTCSVGLSMTPSAGTVVAADVAEAVEARVSVFVNTGGGLPPLVNVDPFGTMAFTDIIIGWSALVPGAVVQGGEGSFTIKYALPDGLLECNTYRKLNTSYNIGVCIALLDQQANWGFPSSDPLYSWSAQYGMRTLTGLNI